METNLAAANVSQARHREAEFDGLHAAAHRSHDDSDELYNGRRFRRGGAAGPSRRCRSRCRAHQPVKGGVNIKRADSGDTLGAAINAPLGVGDYLSTQPDARTEVQLADRTSLRVGAGTQLRFTNLEAASNALQLAAGTVELRLFGNDAAHPEIDTPNVVVRPTEKGRYRVSVDRDGNTLVTVRSGEADVAAQNTTQTLRAASSLEVSGDASNPRVQTVAEIGRDGFDAWNDDRDRYEEAGADYAYVDPAIVGADDLGRYGTWVDEPDYGEVWHPTYAVGWAPYHDGQWVWEPYYGKLQSRPLCTPNPRDAQGAACRQGGRGHPADRAEPPEPCLCAFDRAGDERDRCGALQRVQAARTAVPHPHVRRTASCRNERRATPHFAV